MSRSQKVDIASSVLSFVIAATIVMFGGAGWIAGMFVGYGIGNLIYALFFGK